MLKSFNNTASLFMYISDHGESLGEYGMYLHGAPISIAPNEQKEIPFLVWMSPKFIQRKNLDLDIFLKQSSYSQRYIFHTVMGGFDMKSDIYYMKFDLTKHKFSE
ncbi:MAG: hypothetical protein COB38_03725 [Gammaproteobacteria bacterium]|nr:MAG: hypothetical protein COB38_03725 [Gammaproteobacteria bacterium]